MNLEAIRTFCLSLDGTEEDQPFGDQTLVFKVTGKIFLLLSLDSTPVQFNVKCNPDLAIELREQYECVLPGYHMNKKHWNTIIVNGMLNNNKLKRMIEDSYTLVQAKKR